MAQGDAVVIQQLLNGNVRSTLTLTGYALIRRPLALSTTMRGETKFYQGNPVGEAQLSGTEEGTVTISGYAKTRMLGRGRRMAVFNGDEITTAQDFLDVLDGFVREGLPIQFLWSAVTRIGWIGKLNRTFHTEHDIEWEMEINLLSTGAFTTPAVPTGGTGLENIAADYEPPIVAITDAVEGAPSTLLSRFRTAIEAGATALTQAFDSVNAAVLGFQAKLLPAEDTLRAALAASEQVRDSALGTLNLIRRTPLIGVSADTSVAGLLSSDAFFGSLRAPASELVTKASRRVALLREQLSGGIVSTVRARNGEDLRAVAQRELGDAANYGALLRFNGLEPGQPLQPGQRILIPSAQGVLGRTRV